MLSWLKKADTVTVPHVHQLSAVPRDSQRTWFTFFPLPGEFIHLAPNPLAGNCSKPPGSGFSTGATLEWLFLAPVENKPRFIAHSRSTPHKALQHSFFFPSISNQLHHKFIHNFTSLFLWLCPTSLPLLGGDFYPSVCRRSHTSCK